MINMKYAFLMITLIVVVGVLLVATFSEFQLSNEQYDRLKKLVAKWHYLVAFLALIVSTFEVPCGKETVTIVAGLGAMLAGLMGISNKNYKGEKITEVYNADLLKDMLGFDEDLNLIGEAESEAMEEEEDESEER